jgi:hypothetical protein
MAGGVRTPTGRARICKRLRSPGIDYKESISSAYVAWRAGTTNRLHRLAESFPGHLKRLPIRALYAALYKDGAQTTFYNTRTQDLAYKQVMH